jgi:hypothetical protein
MALAKRVATRRPPWTSTQRDLLLATAESHTPGMPVPAPDYELGQFFDLSPDLLCIAGFDG